MTKKTTIVFLAHLAAVLPLLIPGDGAAAAKAAGRAARSGAHRRHARSKARPLVVASASPLVEDSAYGSGQAAVERERPLSDRSRLDSGDLDDDGTREISAPRCTAQDRPQPNVGIEEPIGLGGCPAGMTPLYGQPACIDRWESHLVELGDGGASWPWSPFFNPKGHRVMARSAPGAVPQGYISGVQAAAACREAGKRLCSPAEWNLACRGPEDRIFPYGNARQPGVCNDARELHPAVEYFGRTDKGVFSLLGHPCINQLPGGLARTGEHEGCVTPGGVYDLMGNLHEWIGDPAGTFKGGFYVDTVGNGPGCLYRTSAHTFDYWDYSTGFRCCADHP